jgi:short-subunit dehydrogenase
MKSKVWFISGISSGLGQALAEAVMTNGDFVIGTFRKQSQTNDFNRKYSQTALGLTLDVTDHSEVERIFEFVRSRFGRTDVLVNNAGFGLAGSIEETSMQEMREIFEANFVSALKITQTFLPLFRQQRKGHIIQISSHGGLKAFAGFGIYNASKFALEGFSEALAQEISPLGLKLTIIEPGPFRTNFAGSSLRQAKLIISDYNQTAGVFRQKIKDIDGKQEGDPARAANAIVKITEMENPPLRLMLGKASLASLKSKIESLSNDLNNSSDIAESVVFD